MARTARVKAKRTMQNGRGCKSPYAVFFYSMIYSYWKAEADIRRRGKEAKEKKIIREEKERKRNAGN